MASASTAFEALDVRLRRLEFALTGKLGTATDESPEMQGQSIPNQLQSVNEDLAKIANQNKNIKRLLQFCISCSSESNNR
jgi:hypothetical protein